MIIKMINDIYEYMIRDGEISLYVIGYLGPVICILISIYYLWGFPKYLIIYVIFAMLDLFINKLLKLWFQQERPLGIRTIIGEEHECIELYGMPSKHLQSIFFSITYLYLVKGSLQWLMVELVIAVLAITQEINYRQHTMGQIIVGALCGIGVAYVANYVGEYWIYEKKKW
jgi:membrane-associated phospholipid phosphatase